jgi:hypothetical protein
LVGDLGEHVRGFASHHQWFNVDVRWRSAQRGIEGALQRYFSVSAAGGYPPFSCVRGIAGGVRERRRVIAAAATAPARMTAQYPTTR